jgi:Acetyltransferase (GNAT) domain
VVGQFDVLRARAGISFGRQRLEWAWQDSRWTDLLIAVSLGNTLVGLLPISFPRSPTWPDRSYDVGQLVVGQSFPANSFCLLGGRTDIRASMLFDQNLPDKQRHSVAEAAVRAGVKFADAYHKHSAALYVPVEESELSAALRGSGMTPHPAPPRSFIKWARPTVESYLASLTTSHRQVVRRDWRLRSSLGLTTSTVSWHDAIDDAAIMINDVLLSHGHQSHPRLVSMRLRRWQSIIGTRGFALCATVDGNAVGYSFGWWEHEKVTMYELGVLPGRSPLRHCSYSDLLVHGPVEVACEHGLATLDLGLFAMAPKRLRGAIASPVYHWTN